MSISQFTDDAYNKFPRDDTSHPGTLIGNWYEETRIREATGEGRTLPQRHLKRRGLFHGDGPKVWPIPVKKDNTFERVHGKRLSGAEFDPCSSDIGNHKCPITGRDLSASDECLGIKLRSEADEASMRLIAEEHVNSADRRDEATKQVRYFDTESGANYSGTQRERYSLNAEVVPAAAAPPAVRAMVEWSADVHYSGSMPITKHTTTPSYRGQEKSVGDGTAEAANRAFFGRSDRFTRPNHEELRHGQVWRDEIGGRPKEGQGLSKAVNSLLEAQKVDPSAIAVPSLVELKRKLRDCLVARDGPTALVLLRTSLRAVAQQQKCSLVTIDERCQRPYAMVPLFTVAQADWLALSLCEIDIPIELVVCMSMKSNAVLDSLPDEARELEGLRHFLQLLCRSRPNMLSIEDLIDRLRVRLPSSHLESFYEALSVHGLINCESGLIDGAKLRELASDETVRAALAGAGLNSDGMIGWKVVEDLVRDMCGCGDVSQLGCWREGLGSKGE
ncbi:hypothetical protein FOZ63_013461 [Perkinsus olseni]|uniref:Uncharacterized protein n=1 Tax=Perkinsus olseni TaxID=32597 RepID=A0A7J6TUR6_PEROL|nr:hypothetical protein FOZ62_010571 [Perkinsus olseni]KAF4754227.1 hypothetical protein FOZ63_013461 [Perkinsus olseni]